MMVRQNLAMGAIFAGGGIFFAVETLRSLSLGNAFRMGPGFFPLIITALLILVGVVTALRPADGEASGKSPVPWRAVLFVGIAPLAFALTVSRFGLAPAIFVTALLSCASSRRMGLVHSLAISAGLTLFSIAVFSFGLGLTVPVLSWAF